MPLDIAIGIFRTLGDAEDVRNRLLHEGVAEDDIELRVLGKREKIPPSRTPQTVDSFVDWLFGKDLPEQYGVLVTNGETAVCVRLRDAADWELSARTMRQFAPLDISRAAPPADEEMLGEAQRQRGREPRG